jgi:hypothetical protein
VLGRIACIAKIPHCISETTTQSRKPSSPEEKNNDGGNQHEMLRLQQFQEHTPSLPGIFDL